MKNELLQRLLEAGLLDIGDNDERLKNIEESIDDLEKKFEKEPNLLPYYTLVAIDPNVPDDEPILSEVMSIITVHWKALRAKFSETPVSLIRAVILHALYNVGEADAQMARIVYLTGTNFYPYAKLSREKDVVKDIISQLGRIAEKHAIEEWSLTSEAPKLKIEALKIGLLEPEAIEIDKNDLMTRMNAAFTNASTGHGPNHGLHQPNYQQHFKDKMATAIADSFNSAFEDRNFDVSSIEKPINKLFSSFKKSFDDSLDSSFRSLRAIERRSKLLWWKETLYSSSLEDSYRNLNEIVQPIIMADDLYVDLPAIVPVSVDYLLRDTVLLLNSKAHKKIPITKVLEDLSQTQNKNILKSYFPDLSVEEKRVTITDFIGLLVNDRVQISSFKAYTGIESKEQVSLSELAVMILHDLMAVNLTKNN